MFIEGDSKEVILDELILIINDNPYLYVKKVSVFWNYNNISSENNELTYNSVKKVIPEGYMTFSMLKKEIEGYGTVTLESNDYDGTCSITSDNAINLKNVGPILGFNKDQTISANTKTKSGNSVNINNGLEYIEIKCDMVERQNNIDTNGKRSDVILTLPITTSQSLKGSVQHYFDIESKIPINKGVYNKLNFNVVGNDNKTQFGSILLELYIL